MGKIVNISNKRGSSISVKIDKRYAINLFTEAVQVMDCYLDLIDLK
jgi:hypothetical protein